MEWNMKCESLCVSALTNPNSILSTLINLSMKQEVDLNMRINWPKVVNFNSKKSWSETGRMIPEETIIIYLGNGGHGHWLMASDSVKRFFT